MNRISLLKCGSYKNKELKKIILESLDNINFDLSTLNNARVIVKPNLLMPAKETKAIITHHEFYRAVVQIVKENGGTPVLLESPAIHSLKRVINKTDYKEVIETENIEVADPAPVKSLSFDDAKSFKKIEISKEYFNADIIFNIPKFKTHGITYVTGAVKLLFGVIPGLAKSKMHFKLPAHTDFSDFCCKTSDNMPSNNASSSWLLCNVFCCNTSDNMPSNNSSSSVLLHNVVFDI